MRKVFLAFAAAALGILTFGSALPAGAISPHTETSASQLSVNVPYLGAVSRDVPAGWTVEACPEGAAPNLVSLTCEGNRVTFTGNGYIADQEPQRVTVLLRFDGAPQRLLYTVKLDPPRLTAPASIQYGVALSQGTPATIPYSERGYSCEACTTGGPTFTAGTVDPKSAGTLRFSSTGIEFRPAPDFTGEAVLGFAIRDSFGQQTDPSQLTVNVFAAPRPAPGAVTDTVQVGVGEKALGNAISNDVFESGDSLTLIACGKPGNGTVICGEDGHFTYTPRPGFSGIDQFSYRIYSAASGAQVVGSVLVGIGADPQAALAVPTGAEATPQIVPASTQNSRTGSTGILGVFQDALTQIQNGH
ncbi:hypothetical protein M2390_001875 [Mycetocola sp. BIGb0189]|uniref:Ig-like domain-containing protein n=1 Tax=Mycetocola sp. BIGb0189 TaxID=2940604 RepID=UPI0021677750|nr:Ig-like domain-containing protein [Mycetocola sp. BIGb0189]MCS4276681.1 hypothetical protein [Mycetocola sp. BIGb0189]